MKILVPIKRVVDYNVKVRPMADGSNVDLNNVKMSVNPFCEIALEEAVRIKEAGNADEVIAISIGKTESQEQLRTALALEDAQAFELISLKPIISYKVNKQSIAIPPAKQGYRGTPYFAKASETFYPAVDLNPAVIDEQMAYLEDIILLCKENNKELIFAYAPIPKQLVVLNEQELFYKNINTLISKHNIKFINMSRSLDLDSEKHFFDNNHLNIDGAKIFSEAFIKELAR